MAEVNRLSHYDDAGQASMVDVSGKAVTDRTARAQAIVRMRPEVIAALPANPKGDPLSVARIAGIQAAKRTAELIPLCHPLPVNHVELAIQAGADHIRIESTVRTSGPTGVEMEALTAAAVAALTVYDMTKALDKAIEITDVYLLEKTGGKSGNYRRNRS